MASMRGDGKPYYWYFPLSSWKSIITYMDYMEEGKIYLAVSLFRLEHYWEVYYLHHLRFKSSMYFNWIYEKVMKQNLIYLNCSYNVWDFFVIFINSFLEFTHMCIVFESQMVLTVYISCVWNNSVKMGY